MRILVFQQAAWDDTNAVGNTLSNWFSSWNDEFFSFFTRKQIPNNSIVKEYYSISAVDIVKGLVKNKQYGRRFAAVDLADESDRISKQHENEQRSIDKLHKKNNDFIYWGMELAWRSKKWIDADFEKFIADVNPDILFAFCTSVYILAPLIKYIKENTRAKIALYIADDVYGDYQRKVFFRRHYLIRLFRQCIEDADLLYGVSEELCHSYGSLFNKQITPLYKGCEVKQTLNNRSWSKPFKIVYAGNLFYGRDNTLGYLAKCLEIINESGTSAQLEIYTGSTVTDDISKKLNICGTSRIVGKRPFSEIRRILSEADIVLHVESFDKDQIEFVRYSFSTKIIDCLESGSLVLGIGPSEISSIKYLAGIPGAYVATDLNMIDSVIRMLINLPNDEKNKCVGLIHDFVLDRHEINKVRTELRSSFQQLAE